MLKFVCSSSAVDVESSCKNHSRRAEKQENTSLQIDNFRKIIKFQNSAVADSSGFLFIKILLNVFQIAFCFFICGRSDSQLILLVVGFDDLSYR